MKASGGLTPGVAAAEDAEVAADMLGDDEGIPRFRKYRYQTTVTRIVVLMTRSAKIDGWVVGTGRMDDELQAKQKTKGHMQEQRNDLTDCCQSTLDRSSRNGLQLAKAQHTFAFDQSMIEVGMAVGARTRGLCLESGC